MAGEESSSELDPRMKEAVGVLEQEMEGFIREDTPEAIQRLSEIKSALKREGIFGGRPILCAWFIADLILTFKDELGDDFEAVSDFFGGLEMLTGSIRAATEEIQGTAEGRLKEAEDDLARITGGESTEIFGTINRFLMIKGVDRKFADKLRGDPSGFGVIDQFIEEVKNGETGRLLRRYYRTWPMFLRGVEFGKDFYRELYPLTENLPNVK